MSDASNDGSLKPALKKAEAELAKHLDEACDEAPDDLSHGSVEDLLRLEEELLAAARAADEAVRLRRRLDVGASSVSGGAEPGSTTRSDGQPSGEVLGEGRVREFRDRQGRPWRVWEVRPGVGRPQGSLHRYLGEYVNGWLAFNSLDDDERKRLAGFPPEWLTMSSAELEALLHRAVEVKRKEVRR